MYTIETHKLNNICEIITLFKYTIRQQKSINVENFLKSTRIKLFQWKKNIIRYKDFTILS